jgi:hypothetical protein
MWHPARQVRRTAALRWTPRGSRSGQDGLEPVTTEVTPGWAPPYNHTRFRDRRAKRAERKANALPPETVSHPRARLRGRTQL